MYKWIEMFINGHMTVTDAERSSCPTIAPTAQNEERARELILQNRGVTVNEIAKQLNISIGSAYSVVYDNLQYHKVCARWVSKELMDDICFCHLAHYCKGGNFLQQIITGNKTWIHHYQPDTKRKSMQCKHPSSPVAKKFKMQPSAGKLMLTIFWYSQGPILKTYLECGTTATCETYCEMFQRGVKPAIHSKTRGRLSEGILLLHNNA
jgi:hypothetical protein